MKPFPLTSSALAAAYLLEALAASALGAFAAFSYLGSRKPPVLISIIVPKPVFNYSAIVLVYYRKLFRSEIMRA